MAKWKIDRTTIFLYLVFFLFLWDLAYFLGLRDPDRFPHPFVIFRTLGDVEFLRGFPAMLRQMIFSLVSGGLIGVAIGSLVLYSSWLTQATLRFLRIGLWLPFLVIFAVPETFWLGITAVTLCTCYHYLAARSLLGLQVHDARTYTVREGVLQALFISLISQIWVQPRWMWFAFWALMNPSMGLGVLTVLVGFLGFVNWLFRSSFDLTAEMCSAIQVKELNSAGWKSFWGVILLTAGGLLIWQLFNASRFNFLYRSPLQVLNVAYYLFQGGELLGDIAFSLLEVLGGMAFGGLAALVLFEVLAKNKTLKPLVSFFLPITYISPIVLWLLIFTWVDLSWHRFLYFGPHSISLAVHKVVAIGCLTFLPFLQALWGLRRHAWPFRILLAVDDALPIAFVTMLFGELMAATAGLGFMMTMASATYQIDKGLAGFLITLLLLVSISSILRFVAKKLYVPEEGRRIPSA